MMMMVDLAAADIDIEALRTNMNKLAEDMGVEINIMNEKVFSAMHRV
jgi:ACT domain-containing protein